VSLTRLEVVDVEHDQTDRLTVAPDLLDLHAQALLEAAMVDEARELVGDGLALHLMMQLDVLERQRSLPGQGAQELPIVVAGRPLPARDGDHAVHPLGRCGGS